MELVAATPQGLYCPAGDFYIDPWRPVARAVITHGHSDHARWGSQAYLCHDDCAPILRMRLGDVAIETLDYGVRLDVGGVAVSLHPAGHVLGSAQVRLEHGGEVWVVSGDYKTEADGVCAPFEPVRCDAFITESTFGLPVYRWRRQGEIMAEANGWWRDNAAAGRASVIFAYSLGKAQPAAEEPRRLDRADLLPWRDRDHERCPSRAGRRPAQDAARVGGGRQGRLRGRARHCAALGRRKRLDAPLRRLFGRLRERLDANPRRQAPARRRSRLRPLGSCRLAGAFRRDPRDGRRAPGASMRCMASSAS